jgi:hypothetical protein
LKEKSALNKQIVVIKEYEQETPLSYHFINKNTLKGKKEVEITKKNRYLILFKKLIFQ